MAYAATPKRTQIAMSGLIAAPVVFSENTVTFSGPLTFDEEVVTAELTYTVAVDPDDHRAVADALSDLYMAEFDGWCDRKSAARAAETAAARVRGPRMMPHQPCPTLWAGR
ncbi:hypothetical protein ACOI1H_20680 [Loktanella sp. DJP18]|uniref:hypothetical protein n=1 Tax=Loktanella sp. DJP18 TaxID=3409788 RepID=UPI003BB6F595